MKKFEVNSTLVLSLVVTTLAAVGCEGCQVPDDAEQDTSTLGSSGTSTSTSTASSSGTGTSTATGTAGSSGTGTGEPQPEVEPVPEPVLELGMAKLVARAYLHPTLVDQWIAANDERFDARFWSCFDALESYFLGTPPVLEPNVESVIVALTTSNPPPSTAGYLLELGSFRSMIGEGVLWRDTPSGAVYDLALLTTLPPSEPDIENFDREAAAQRYTGGQSLADPYVCGCVGLACRIVFIGLIIDETNL